MLTINQWFSADREEKEGATSPMIFDTNLPFLPDIVQWRKKDDGKVGIEDRSLNKAPH